MTEWNAGNSKMKYLYKMVLLSVTLLMAFIVYVQAENNKQLIYDLNVSQTAFKIQKANYERLESQIAKGTCLPKLEGFTK